MEELNSKIEDELTKDPLEDFFEEALNNAPFIGSGRDGIVLKVDISKLNKTSVEKTIANGVDISENDKYAIKMLKIFNRGIGQKEYEIQRHAYEITKDIDNIAKIPKPILIKTQHLTESEKHRLSAKGVIDDDVEIILMDFIDGQDLNNIIRDFIIKIEGNGEFNFRDFIAMKDDDIIKFMRFLKKSKFHIDESLLAQIEKTIQTLENHGIFHNDLHEGNVMIDKNGIPFIIDFGRSVLDKSESSDNFALIRRYRELNKEKVEEIFDKKYWDDLKSKINKSEKWTSKINSWKKLIETNNFEQVANHIHSTSNEEGYFTQSLGALISIADKNTKEKLIKVLKLLESKNKIDYLKVKISDCIKYLSLI